MRILNILIDCLICEIGGILYEKNLGAKPYLFPQPVMIIASYDEHGEANAMNAAWGGIVGMDQIIISLGDHQTTDNIMINGLKEWDNEKGYLTDTCLTAQDKYKAYLNYFRIAY